MSRSGAKLPIGSDTKNNYYMHSAKKVSNNVVGRSGVVYRHNVEWYLKRQLMYYDELIKDNKIKAISDETAWLDMIETALKYRKSLKDTEKASKKLKKKIS